MYRKIAGVTFACLISVVAQAKTQGVTDKEIVLGLITDLSGPVSQYGKESRNGMLLKIEEINAKGGINGRKIRLVAEDNGYDPKKAVLAAQKLVSGDNVFAVLGHLGTATNISCRKALRKSCTNQRAPTRSVLPLLIVRW
jgi:branched-chain amino acid transport system substrate-binding protein